VNILANFAGNLPLLNKKREVFMIQSEPTAAQMQIGGNIGMTYRCQGRGTKTIRKAACKIVYRRTRAFHRRSPNDSLASAS
jgi:hypothetical protein